MGNNNAYAQDNEITWMNWDLTAQQTRLLAYTQRLLALRQAYPVLRRRHFFRGEPVAGSSRKDVTWIRPDGQEFTDVDWRKTDACVLGMLIDGAATDEADERGHAVHGDTLLILTNGGESPVSFTLPALDEQGENFWVIMIDTARDELPIVRQDMAIVEAHAVMLLRFGTDRRVSSGVEQRREMSSLAEQHTP